MKKIAFAICWAIIGSIYFAFGQADPCSNAVGGAGNSITLPNLFENLRSDYSGQETRVNNVPSNASMKAIQLGNSAPFLE